MDDVIQNGRSPVAVYPWERRAPLEKMNRTTVQDTRSILLCIEYEDRIKPSVLSLCNLRIKPIRNTRNHLRIVWNIWKICSLKTFKFVDLLFLSENDNSEQHLCIIRYYYYTKIRLLKITYSILSVSHNDSRN